MVLLKNAARPQRTWEGFSSLCQFGGGGGGWLPHEETASCRGGGDAIFHLCFILDVYLAGMLIKNILTCIHEDFLACVLVYVHSC
jgi:hypothetical protein